MRMASVLFVLLSIPVLVPHPACAGSKKKAVAPKSALIIIDVQQFYFPGGAMPLHAPESAAANAAKLIERFRQSRDLVIHVGHNAKQGAAFHASVKPEKGEKVLMKDEVNAFVNTDLLAYLKKHKVKRLVFCGMQTHMCVEGAVRAAHDFGFECVLVHDACATRALSFGGKSVSAADVHLATLSALDRTYARVIDTAAYLKSK